MRASFWIGLGFAVLLSLPICGWYFERERAQRAIIDKEQIALKLQELLQNPASHDQSDVDLPGANAGAIGASKRSDSTPGVLPNRAAIGAATNAVSPPKVEATNAIAQEETNLSSDTRIPSGAASEAPPYTELQLEMYRCCNQMNEINIAAERWAADHKGLIPSSLMELRGYLAPMILICPGTRPKSLSTAWEEFKPDDIPYRINPSSKGELWDFQIHGQASPATVTWLHCSIHKKLHTMNRVEYDGIPSSQEFRPGLQR